MNLCKLTNLLYTYVHVPILCHSLFPFLSLSLPSPSLCDTHTHTHTHTYTLCLIPYSEYATDVNVLVARKAIQAIGKIALRLPGRANTCTEKLLSLISMEISHVTCEALVSLASK